MSTPPTDDHRAGGRLGPRQFWAIFEHAQDAMWIVDEAQRIVAANPAACLLCGMARAELLQHRFVDLLASPTALAFQRSWQTLAGQGYFDSPFQFCCADRTLRDAEVSATANFLPGQHLIVARDVTLQNWALGEVERQKARLAALRTVDHTRITSRDFLGTLNTILDQIITQLEVDATAVLLLNAPGTALSYAATRGIETDRLSQEWLQA